MHATGYVSFAPNQQTMGDYSLVNVPDYSIPTKNIYMVEESGCCLFCCLNALTITYRDPVSEKESKKTFRWWCDVDTNTATLARGIINKHLNEQRAKANPTT